MEEAQERFIAVGCHHFFRRRYEGVAFIFKFLDDVFIVMAFRAFFRLGNVTAGTAAHDDVRTMIVFQVLRS